VAGLARRFAAAGAAALAIGVWVPAADAHGGSGVVFASDFEARSLAFRPAIDGLTAAAIGGDVKLALHVPRDREVVVLGREGEPFLRFADGRVLANERSTTAATARIVTLTGATLDGPPIWHELRRGRSYSWHESRLRPAIGPGEGLVAAIAIPLRVDGRRVTLVGSSWHASPPSALVWLVPLLGLLVAAVATIAGRARPSWPLVRALGAVAVVSAVLTIVGFAFHGPSSTLRAGLEIGVAAIVASTALIALATLRDAERPFVAVATGTVCLLYAVSVLPVLTHGFALSWLPTDLMRVTVAAALVSSAWLLLLGGVEFFDELRPRRRTDV
jgi:hypothetical protein